MGEDGTTAMNFIVERHGGAPVEKREREECRWLELKTCSPPPDRLHSVALRPPTTARCSSEPLRPTTRHSSAPRRLPRAPPSVARQRAAHPPAARLRAERKSARQLRPHSSKLRKSHCPLCSIRAKYLPLPVSTCQRLSKHAKYYICAYGANVCHKV